MYLHTFSNLQYHLNRAAVIKRYISMVFVVLAMAFLAACAPEVGSEQWCKEMKGKQPGDWTANQAVDYAKHCVLK